MRANDNDSFSIPKAAKLSFEAIDNPGLAEMMPRASFDEWASFTYGALNASTELLRKSPDEMTAIFRAADNDGEALAETLSAINDAREFLRPLMDVLDCIHSRVVIAGSKIAVSEAGLS